MIDTWGYQNVKSLVSDLTADEWRQFNVNRYFQLIAYTILIHEYCLTFTLEVERFWGRKKATWVTIFFFLNRYYVPLGQIPGFLLNFWYPRSHNNQMICHHLELYDHTYAFVVQVIVSAMLIMRTYALYGRSLRVLALTTSVMLVLIGFGCWDVISKKAEYKETHEFIPMEYFVINGCTSPMDETLALKYVNTWGTLLAFDTLIFGLTLYKMLLSLRSGYESSILTLMLRDGSLYFGIMVAFNVANLVTFVYGGTFNRICVTYFVNSLSSVMITRLMLNMRDPRLCTIEGTTVADHSLLNFSTIVASTGTVVGGRNHHQNHVGGPSMSSTQK